MITGNDFIELLYLNIENSKIIEMMKELDAPKPMIDKDFKTDGGNSIPIQKLNVELFFKDAYIYDAQEYSIGTVIFSGITFSYKSKILLPFNLKMGDSYDTVVKKLNKKQDYNNEFLPQKIWNFTRDDGQVYLLYAFFEDDYTELLHVSLFPYTKAVEA